MWTSPGVPEHSKRMQVMFQVHFLASNMREGIKVKRRVAITETPPSPISLGHGAASEGRTAENSAARQQTGPAVGGLFFVAHSGEAGKPVSEDQFNTQTACPASGGPPWGTSFTPTHTSPLFPKVGRGCGDHRNSSPTQ